MIINNLRKTLFGGAKSKNITFGTTKLQHGLPLLQISSQHSPLSCLNNEQPGSLLTALSAHPVPNRRLNLPQKTAARPKKGASGLPTMVLFSE